MSILSRRLAVLFGAFVLLGLPDGLLGAAWPSIRVSLERPEAALAQLIIAHTLGYLFGTGLMGRVVDRLGLDPTIRLGLALTIAGLAGYALAPTWSLLLGAGFALGWGGGVVDASINAEVALRHGQRTMNLLHAAYGVGATLGPLLIASFLELSLSWRFAYLILIGFEVAVLASLAPRAGARGGDGSGGEATERYADPARRPRAVVVATLVYFAIYVGAEVSVGHWTYSVLTEERGVGSTLAGVSVAAYWGGLTVGRLALGVVAERLHPMSLLRGSALAALVAIVWFLTDVRGSTFALPVLGLSFAGVFPALVLMTSSWLPPSLVTRVVGWQLAAASGGAIAASAVLGVVADRAGLDATVIGMAVLVGLLAAAHVATESAAR